MQWRGRRASPQVRDLRGQRGPAAGGSGGAGLIVLLLRLFGWKGLVVALFLGVVAWQMGLIDLQPTVRGNDSGQPVVATAEEQELFEFVRVVLADTEDVWTKEFARLGLRYELPTMAVYRERVATSCGIGVATMGPFYCPADRRIYLDLGFYNELARTFKAPGDFAQAYVIAHEVGHHVQELRGATKQVADRRGAADANEYSVRLELQADFLAGVWAHHSQRYLESGDIEEAMRAANAIGDDAIQRRQQGRVVPHSFTHGTSAQRQRWFAKGLKSGRIEDGDTFSLPYKEL